MAQTSAQQNVYTESDYYNLPEDVRAELIDGQLIYNQAAPSRIHQTILSELHTVINNYINIGLLTPGRKKYLFTIWKKLIFR